MSCVFKFTTNTVGLLVQMIAHKILIKIGVVYVLWESGNTVETINVPKWSQEGHRMVERTKERDSLTENPGFEKARIW